LKGHHS